MDWNFTDATEASPYTQERAQAILSDFLAEFMEDLDADDDDD